MKPAIGFSYDAAALNKINLNHLLYFWAVARAGSMTGAATAMGVSQSAISEQLRTLEQRLGAPLLVRTGRGVRLTPAGERAQRYAEEVVGVCSELVRTLPLAEEQSLRPLIVGAADSVPKIVVRSLLGPLLDANPGQRIVCREWTRDQLLAELSLFRLDAVITDTPVAAGPSPGLSTFSAGASAIAVSAVPRLARRFSRDFPTCLTDAPFLLPAPGPSLRQSIDQWFALNRITPRIVVEAEDRSQLHYFAESGHGLVFTAAITAPDLKRQFGLIPVGTARGLREDYFAVFVDRKSQHPLIGALREHLRTIQTSRDAAASRRPGRR